VTRAAGTTRPLSLSYGQASLRRYGYSGCRCSSRAPRAGRPRSLRWMYPGPPPKSSSCRHSSVTAFDTG
jgi:hypothetical protein